MLSVLYHNTNLSVAFVEKDTNALLVETVISLEARTPKHTFVRVTRVIDGDTIEIEGGQKVRYIGINAPESVHPKKPVQCFAKEAHGSYAI